MKQKNRIIIAIIILVVIIGVVLGIDYFRRRNAASQAPVDMPPGSIPIFLDGGFLASFVPEDLEGLQDASFVDSEEGKTQDGWLLKDVLLLHIDSTSLKGGTKITVSSSSREKSKTLSWETATDPQVFVMFDLANKGTIKFISNMPGFDTRDSWVQDVDKIEVETP
jgi:hypothetical protein